ncbi:MAG: tetratricopeptide repeat protein [Nitrospirota bacterium]
MKAFKIVRGIIVSAILLHTVSCAGLQARQARSEFDTGLSLFNSGRYADAVSHFEKAIEFDPEFGKGYLYLGRSYLNLGRWREAVPPLRTAFRLAPDETKREIADIVLDIFLRHGRAMDEESQSEIRDLLRQ